MKAQHFLENDVSVDMNAFGVRGHVRAFKAATCRRTPYQH